MATETAIDELSTIGEVRHRIQTSFYGGYNPPEWLVEAISKREDEEPRDFGPLPKLTGYNAWFSNLPV